MAAEEYPDERINALEGILSPEEPYYDPEIVADTAVWPVVDELWRGDWRRGAYPGLNFQFPRRAQCGESMVDVYLIAGCELAFDDDNEAAGSDRFTSCATLMIETTAVDTIRDYMLERAYDSWRSIESASAQQYDKDELIAKSCIEYAFNTEGDLYIKTSQDVVRASDGDVVWSSEYDDENPEDTDQVKLHADDLERIGEALMILTDSFVHFDITDAISKNPIKEE